jgi:SAM-dependent methyltransferase
VAHRVTHRNQREHSPVGQVEPQKLASWRAERDVIEGLIRRKAQGVGALNVLEAGCGTSWGLDLKGISYTLTGVDIDKAALDIRVSLSKDIDHAILGDLRSVVLEPAQFDVIYNSYVLEHVEGAELVLSNFARWLKPGGVLILIIPNRDSVKGFITRMTPFWVHVLFKKYVQGEATAGKPGHAPFPTLFDEVVSRHGISDFCERHGFILKEEYSVGHGRPVKPVFQYLSLLIVWSVQLASFGTLTATHSDLMYVLEKRQG